LFDVARKLRRRQVGETQRFDIALTVSSTLQALGYPRFRFRPETRFPEYLVLIERASPGDHQAAQFDKLSRALEQEHLFITRFFFESDPRYCWSDSDPTRFSLVELQKRFPAHRLLIFSGAEILLDPVSGELASWTTTLLEWSERAVLTAAASSQWGFAERKVAAQFVVLPATLDGLDRLAERFDPDLRREPAGTSRRLSRSGQSTTARFKSQTCADTWVSRSSNGFARAQSTPNCVGS
jgi:hypothetical protein